MSIKDYYFRLNRRKTSICGKLLASTLLLMTAVGLNVGVAAAQQAYPDPSDEAKLYENAKAEGGKVVYYFGQPAEQAATIANRFQEKYPGVTVEAIRLVGPVLHDRFTKERKAGQDIADVLYVGDYSTMMDLINKGMVAEWKVPTYDRIPENARYGKDGTNAYSVQFSDNVIAYNPNSVSPEEVDILREWGGVLDPRFKGRFGVSAQACATCYIGLQMFLSDPKYGEKFLRGVAAQKPKIYPGTNAAVDRMIAGEIDFVFWSFESYMAMNYSRGAPVRWLHPSPTPLVGPIVGISDRAPHPNSARLFLNWLMSEDGAKTVLGTGAMATLKGMDDNRPFRSEPWYDPIKEIYKVDFDLWDKRFFEDSELWSNLLKE